MRLSSTNMQARKMLFAAISSICVLSQTLKNQIPKRVKIFFFFFSFFGTLLLALILSKVVLSLRYLLMDELHKAVAQFYPSTSGGMYGGSCTPPGAFGEPSFFLPAQGKESQDPTNTAASEGHGRTHQDFLQELKQDLSLNLTFRNYLIVQ